jgi:hypothetical protein
VPLPPSKPPSRLGQPPADDAPRSRREKDPLDLEARAVEEELEALKARYDQYFLGIERREPSRWRDEIRKRVMRLKGEFTRNTGLKFRVQTLHARYLSYERLWLRSAREKEEGRYRRDVYKARLHRRRAEAAAPAPAPAAGEAAAAAPAVPRADEAAKAPPARKPAAGMEGARAKPGEAPAAPSAVPSPLPTAARPEASRPPPRPAASAGGMDEGQLRALYNAYLAAKMTCREDVSKLTYDAVVRTVTKQIPELMARYNAKSVDFKVEVKGGKAILKAIPKV